MNYNCTYLNVLSLFITIIYLNDSIQISGTELQCTPYTFANGIVGLEQ